jgi:hypothetical protein
VRRAVVARCDVLAAGLEPFVRVERLAVERLAVERLEDVERDAAVERREVVEVLVSAMWSAPLG